MWWHSKVKLPHELPASYMCASVSISYSTYAQLPAVCGKSVNVVPDSHMETRMDLAPGLALNFCGIWRVNQ